MNEITEKNIKTEKEPSGSVAPAAGESESAEQPAGEDSLEELRMENRRLKERLSLEAAREQVLAESKKATAISPQLIFDSVKSELKFDGDGNAANAAELVSDLKERFPEQFGAQSQAGSIDGGAGTGASPMPLTAETLAKMTPAEIARLDWDEVRRVLSS